MKATRIVHLLPTWEHIGALRRIGMLAANVGARSYQQHVVALSARGPDPQAIARLPLPCTALAAGRRLSLAAAWRLRRFVRDWQADVVHVWSSSVERLARAAMLGLHGVRLVAADVAALRPAIDAEALHAEVASAVSRQQHTSQLGLPAKARLVGTAGRLVTEKQTIELFWALDQIRCVRDDVYLLVIGDGESRPLFERYARLYHVSDFVRFLGWRGDAAALIAQLDVYCTASAQTYCSLAVLEAMALGVPVVAADTEANRQIIVPGQTGLLVDVRKRSEIARWCLRVLEDAELATQIRSAARQAVESFAVESFVSQCRELYERRADAPLASYR